MSKHSKIAEIDFLRWLLGITLVIVLLYLGRALFVPLCFALFLSFLAYPVSRWLEEKGISKGVSICLIILSLFLPLTGILVLLFKQSLVLVEQWPVLKSLLLPTLDKVYGFFATFVGIAPEVVKGWAQGELLGNASQMLLLLLQQMASVSVSTLTTFLLVPVYVALLLYYRGIFVSFVHALFPSQSTENIRVLLKEASVSYFAFVKGMGIVYVIVGLLNSIGLYFLGVPHAFIYGFVVAFSTVIPYVGIIVGSLVPMIVAWSLYGSLWYPFLIALMFGIVQVLEANVIFPMAVGNRMEINPLMILIAVVGGGIIWGVSGMILFIPLLGMLKTVSDRSETLRPLSILLGRGNDKELSK